MCLVEWGTPLFIQGLEAVMKLILAQNPVSTALAWFHATATRRRGRAAPGRERLHPGSGRPLIDSDGHWLRTVGSGLDIQCVLVVFCPVGVELVASLLFLCANECHKCLFQWISLCTRVCDLQNVSAPKLMESVSWKPLVLCFDVHFCIFYVNIGGKIMS
jgi:hypothetical protein